MLGERKKSSGEATKSQLAAIHHSRWSPEAVALKNDEGFPKPNFFRRDELFGVWRTLRGPVHGVYFVDRGALRRIVPLCR
jgi:ABC-type sulfate transport system substrate-binding protein